MRGYEGLFPLKIHKRYREAHEENKETEKCRENVVSKNMLKSLIDLRKLFRNQRPNNSYHESSKEVLDVLMVHGSTPMDIYLGIQENR